MSEKKEKKNLDCIMRFYSLHIKCTYFVLFDNTFSCYTFFFPFCSHFSNKENVIYTVELLFSPWRFAIFLPIFTLFIKKNTYVF